MKITLYHDDLNENGLHRSSLDKLDIGDFRLPYEYFTRANLIVYESFDDSGELIQTVLKDRYNETKK